MNAKSQNISRILKITKHFVKESNFNHSLSKHNDSFYTTQLHNLIPKLTSKQLRLNLFKGNITNSNSCVYLNSLLKPSRQQLESRSFSMPIIFNYINPSDSVHLRSICHRDIKNKIKHKAFSLSYNLETPSSRCIYNYNYNNSNSVRIINDVLFSCGDDTEYQTLRYEEGNIFYDSKSILRRLQDAFNKVIEHYHSYETTFHNVSKHYITKSINAKTENEVNFKLTSIIIKITHCINTANSYEFKLPLFLVPIFLYNPIQHIPTLLLSIITFTNKCNTISYETKDKLYFVIVALYNALKEVQTTTNNEIRKYHEYVYTWITPNDAYNVKVRMPLLTVKFTKTNTVIHKYIEHKLLLYLYDNNFDHWTFYAVHYLYSFKNFRNVVDSISSKMNSSHIKYVGKDITISERRVKTNNVDDTQLMYFLTSERCDNYILHIHSMFIEVTLNNTQCVRVKGTTNSLVKSSTKKLYRIFRNSISQGQKFTFTFKELNPLFEATLHMNVLDFLAKFISINTLTKQAEFNYKELHVFTVQMVKKLFNNSVNYDNSSCNNSNSSNNNNGSSNNFKVFQNYMAKVVFPVFAIKGVDEMGKLSSVVKDEYGEVVHLKEFEMNMDAIGILMKNGGELGSDVDVVRMLLFYLESEYHKNYMVVNMDENNGRRTGLRRFSTLRRKTRTRTNVSASSFVVVGE